MAALIFGYRKFPSILSHQKFILNTDSNALKSIKELKQGTGILIRWAEEFAALEFDQVFEKKSLNKKR
ncbi:MAG: hypothetical protein GY696_24240 [Gammaproteobacteria bacterium]|nr:hypothetical protein [Gammaproteobacteria bacterium]